MTANAGTFVPGEYLRVLMLEDSPNDANRCLLTLERAGYEVRADVVSTYAEFSQHLDQDDYDIILADYQLPTWSDLKALELLAESGKPIPFILVTACYCEETARQVIANGTGDYLLKNQLGRLPSAVRRVLRRERSPCEHGQMALEEESLMAQLQHAAEEVGQLNGSLLISQPL
jgi:DNA-binding NtrC family response regulator